VRTLRQHREDGVGRRDRIGDGCHDAHAMRGRRLVRLGVQVEPHDVMAGRHEIGGHRTAHVAQADPGDRCHVPSYGVIDVK
jgi:hypothetical protein